MAKKTNVLAELLKCALFGDEIDEQTKKLISENAKTVHDVAVRHDIAHLVEYALKKSGIDVSDEAVAYDFLKQQVMSVMRYENLNLALTNISELFENEKIPFVPLKGAVIRKFYPEPWMRTSCDIDILVREEDLERAKKAAVEMLGFKADEEHYYHDVSLYSDEDVHLELHFSIKENMENIDKMLEKVWDYATPVREGAYEYALTNEFFMFQTVAHMSYHFVGGGCGIRNFIDLFLLKNNLTFDENMLTEMLEMCEIKTFYELSLKLSDVWFSDAEHDETTRLMHNYILGGGLYGAKANGIAARRADKGKFAYIFERIFLPYEQLVITYPNLKGKPLLTPFYQIKRWCRIVSKGKVAHSAKELAVIGGIANEQIDDIAELLQKTGLKK